MTPGAWHGPLLAFSAGVHIDHGAIREMGLDTYRLGRMYNSPFDITAQILPPTADLGGAGELGLPAACAAAANSWARATGRTPRRFCISSIDVTGSPRKRRPRRDHRW